MKRFAGKINKDLLFILLQTILYGAFLTLDLTGGSISLSGKIKFTIIILCFCYAVFSNGKGSRVPTPDAIPSRKVAFKSIIFLLQAALFFTVVSDLFILLLDYYLYGVLTFIIVQLLYGLRLEILREKHPQQYLCDTKHSATHVNKQIISSYMRQVLLRIIVAIVIIILLSFAKVELEGLLIVTTFYFVCILFNVMLAIKVAVMNPKEKSNVIFAVGMFLFLLCDINVGLFNLSGFITMPQDLYVVIYSISSILMWTFYAPAQVLIAISSK